MLFNSFAENDFLNSNEAVLLFLGIVNPIFLYFLPLNSTIPCGINLPSIILSILLLKNSLILFINSFLNSSLVLYSKIISSIKLSLSNFNWLILSLTTFEVTIDENIPLLTTFFENLVLDTVCIC